jgi:Tfp pilus assembly protein PilF
MFVERLIGYLCRKYRSRRLARGFLLLDQGDFSEAETVARALVRAGFPGGWELLAAVYFEQGKIHHALQTLEDGTRQFPLVGSLWDLYGIYLSAHGRHAEARAALGRALDCPGVCAEQIGYNLAIVFAREKKFERALEILERIQKNAPSEDERIRYKLFELEVLAECREPPAVRTHAESLLAEINASKDPLADAGARRHAIVRLHCRLARLMLDAGNAAEAMAHVKDALRTEPQNPEALDVLRQAHGQRSERGRSFKVLIQGELHTIAVGNGTKSETIPLLPFFRNFQVVAEDLDECKSFIDEFEALEAARAVTIIDHAAAESMPGEYKGVCWVSSHAFHHGAETPPSTTAEQAAARRHHADFTRSPAP